MKERLTHEAAAEQRSGAKPKQWSSRNLGGHGKKQRLVFVTSDLYYVRAFLARQIKLAAETYDVTLIVNADTEAASAAIGHSGKVLNLGVHRKISLLRDMLSLLRMIWFFIVSRPAIVHSTTPKAGMIAMLAAKLSGVPFRMHTFTGQVWQTRTGLMRKILIAADKLTVWSASLILADSHSQRDLLVESHIVSERKSGVIGHGSICGIDLNRFRRNVEVRAEMRKQLGLSEETVVILYMARFTVDKGAMAMAQAYAQVAAVSTKPVHLLMVGPDEEQLTEKINKEFEQLAGKFSLISYTDNPEAYFQCCDIFCLPSFREGFPMVLLNAAASELPVVASKIYGCTDAVEHRVTGSLFEPGNIAELRVKLTELIESEQLRRTMGIQARKRVESFFSEEKISKQLMEIYKNKKI